MVNKVDQQIAHGTIKSNGKQGLFTVSLANTSQAGKDELSQALSGGNTTKPENLGDIKRPQQFALRQEADHASRKAKKFQEMIADELKEGKIKTKEEFEAMDKMVQSNGKPLQRRKWNKVRKEYMKQFGIQEPPKQNPANTNATRPVAGSTTKSEAPAAKQETPAAKQETPAAKQEAPTAKLEAPAAKSEAHAATATLTPEEATAQGKLTPEAESWLNKTKQSISKGSAAESAKVYEENGLTKIENRLNLYDGLKEGEAVADPKARAEMDALVDKFGTDKQKKRWNNIKSTYDNITPESAKKPNEIHTADNSIGHKNALRQAERTAAEAPKPAVQEHLGTVIKDAEKLTDHDKKVLNQVVREHGTQEQIAEMNKVMGNIEGKTPAKAIKKKSFGKKLAQRLRIVNEKISRKLGREGKGAIIAGLLGLGIGLLLNKCSEDEKVDNVSPSEAAPSDKPEQPSGIAPMPAVSDSTDTDTTGIVTPVVPAESDKVEETPEEKETSADETEETKADGLYTVKKGDNPWAIALEYLKSKNENFDYKKNPEDNKKLIELQNKIIEANEIKVYRNKNGVLIGLIFPGQQLKIEA